MTAPKHAELVVPFQLNAANVRGRAARLDNVLEGVLSQHEYPSVVERLVAETTLLTALIGQTIKLRWKLSVQVRGDGPIRLIAADYRAPEDDDAPAQLRAYSSFDAARLDPNADPFEQIGNGYFAILIDQGNDMAPYQGITPLAGGSLSSCAETYFAQSEQLPTQFKLAFGKSKEDAGPETWRGGGIMLQHMPKASELLEAKTPTDQERPLSQGDLLDGDDEENWNRANILMGTTEELELVGPNVPIETLVNRLFHQEGLVIDPVQAVEFGCSCSAEKVKDSLSIYSAKEINTMVSESGQVTADCQFCGAHYAFDPSVLGFEAQKEDGADT